MAKKKNDENYYTPFYGNTPPQALDVEAAVLGAMLVEPSTIDESMEELTASCFYDPKHRKIFEAMRDLYKEHVAIDLISVSEKLRAQGNLETTGGPKYLADLSQNIGAAAHIEYYLKILEQKAIQRNLIAASYKTIQEAFDDTVIVDNLIENANSRLYDAVQVNPERNTQDIGSLIMSQMADLQQLQKEGRMSGIPSGYPSIDRVTQGWQKGSLIVVGAHPSVGKTAFVSNIARNAAVDHNVPVLIFSLEKTAKQLVDRLTTTESGLSGEKIRGGAELEPFEWEQLEYTLKRLMSAPLYIDDTPDICNSEFAVKARHAVKEKGVKLIIIDCIQMMKGPDGYQNNRTQEISAIIRTLKTTAMRLNVPVIAVSQLSRDTDKKYNGLNKPKLSNLRDSGALEHVADMVIFIHRPEFTGMSEDPADREKAWIIIAKNSDGETCDIEMKYKPGQIKFIEPDQSLDIRAQRPYVSAATYLSAARRTDDGDGYNFEDSPF